MLGASLPFPAAPQNASRFQLRNDPPRAPAPDRVDVAYSGPVVEYAVVAFSTNTAYFKLPDVDLHYPSRLGGADPRHLALERVDRFESETRSTLAKTADALSSDLAVGMAGLTGAAPEAVSRPGPLRDRLAEPPGGWDGGLGRLVARMDRARAALDEVSALLRDDGLEGLIDRAIVELADGEALAEAPADFAATSTRLAVLKLFSPNGSLAEAVENVGYIARDTARLARREERIETLRRDVREGRTLVAISTFRAPADVDVSLRMNASVRSAAVFASERYVLAGEVGSAGSRGALSALR